MRDGDIHKLMLSFDITDKFEGWNTEKEAKDAMEEVAQSAVAHFEQTPS